MYCLAGGSGIHRDTKKTKPGSKGGISRKDAAEVYRAKVKVQCSINSNY